MRFARHALLTLLLAFAGTAAAQVKSEAMVALGRAAGDKDIDVVRLYYRWALGSDPRWWVPTYLQFGGGIWRVPDLGGTTQRYDLSVTPVWRKNFERTYVEGGIGGYMLSHTINNDTTHLPTSWEFGSHIGAGLRIGERREATIGIALQHLSNGGIKQPNGGVNFLLLNASFPL